MLLKGLDLTPDIKPDIESVIRAVDAAFKSEVLEYRIRNAVNSQALNEAYVSHVPPYETLTGMHHWDFDWWLTGSYIASTPCWNGRLSSTPECSV